MWDRIKIYEYPVFININNKFKMKNIVAFSILFLALASCGQKKYPQGIEHVIIIGIDGMSTQGLLEASTPCMDSLMREGAYAYDVRCVLPAVSAPNWAAMLNGAGPEATGVLDNSWKRDQWSLPAVAKTGNIQAIHSGGKTFPAQKININILH
ncbi:hypothetical protein FACS1894181_07580 [Bacteroidia bacterium]|nr:hypothetical protein FACS1894181_07580 [Bacteroidia bacterium]